MAVTALSPNGVLGVAPQINPQAKTDTQVSVPQVAQDAQKTAVTSRTDTVTISPEAVKLAERKDAAAKEDAKKAEQQLASQAAHEAVTVQKSVAQKSAERAYAIVSAI